MKLIYLISAGYPSRTDVCPEPCLLWRGPRLEPVEPVGPLSQEYECCEERKVRTGTEGGGDGGQLARAKSMKNCIGLHCCRSKLRVGLFFFVRG